MNKFFGHLKTVLKHRHYVFINCCKCGIVIQGLFHDLSKFSFIEFWEGVKYYKGTSSPIDECKRVNGYSNAWFHHKGINKHHCEYWMDNFDKGGEAIKMPFKYAVEMFCDYMGAAKSYLGKNFNWKSEYDWWQKIRLVRIMHKDVRTFIDKCIEYVVTHEKMPSYKELKKMYY